MKEEEFNPSTSEAFQRNLDKVFEELVAEKESVPLDTSVEDDFQWIDIDKEIEKKIEKNKETDSKQTEIKNNKQLEVVKNIEKVLQMEAAVSLEPNVERKTVRETFDEVPSMSAEEEEKLLQGINEALAAQIASEFGETEQKEEKKQEKPVSRIWKRIPRWAKASMITLGSIVLIFGLLLGTKPGRRVLYGIVARVVHSGIVNEEPGKHEEIYEGPLGDDYINPELVEKDEEGNVLDDEGNVVIVPVEDEDESEIRSEEYCYNILLMGEEAIDSYGANGRTDLIMIATINAKEKKLKLTSIMRDSYAQIPGHEDNKINAAFAKGGASLLVNTIEQNLKIKIDGYVKVGFDGFEQIIDRLGGVEISLTAEEAEYLRTHNYISKPEYRNVVAGKQWFNGNQTLGYCRVRYVPTADGLYNDHGRTARQRAVLTQLFQKYKTHNFVELASILYDCLGLVTSDLSAEAMTKMLELVIEERILELETSQIPAKSTFTDTYIGKMSVLSVNWPANAEILQEFIFGAEEATESNGEIVE